MFEFCCCSMTPVRVYNVFIASLVLNSAILEQKLQITWATAGTITYTTHLHIQDVAQHCRNITVCTSQTADSSKGSGLNVSRQSRHFPLIKQCIICLNEGGICCHIGLQSTHHIHLHAVYNSINCFYSKA